VPANAYVQTGLASLVLKRQPDGVEG